MRRPIASWSLQWQHRHIVDTVAPAFPAVERISLNRYTVWRQQGGTRTTTWVPVIPKPDVVKSCLEQLFQTKDPTLEEVIDVDGCYASLFSSTEINKLTPFARNALGLANGSREGECPC